MKKTIKDLDLQGKKVLIRVDFNVPIKNGVITSNKRILAALPTINFAIESGAKVILLSHLGRVKTNEDKKGKSLKIVAEELSKQLRQRVIFVPETRGKLLEDKIKDMLPKDVLMIENTRFEDLNNSAESKNAKELGKYWASLGDVFINDAFGTSHRAHASNVGIAENIKESAIGFLIQEELSMLAKAIYGNNKPFVAIIGGAKISDKIKVIDNLIDKVDYLIIGGGMAYTFCASQGISIGNSLVENDKIDLAREYMKKYSHKIILPIDSAISVNFANNVPLFNKDNSLEIPEGFMGLDIGPKTIKIFKNILSGAKTVLWNGPMGVAEFDNYKFGTESLANIISSQPNVFSIIGGGDSAAAIINLGLEKKFSHISTGGGASLQFLEGGVLPGIESIQEFVRRNIESVKQPQPINKPNTLTQPVKPNQPQPINKPDTLTQPVKPNQPQPINKPDTLTQPVKPNQPQPINKPNTLTQPVKPNQSQPINKPNTLTQPVKPNQPTQKTSLFSWLRKKPNQPQPINKPNQPQPINKPDTLTQPVKPNQPQPINKPDTLTQPVKPNQPQPINKPDTLTQPVKPNQPQPINKPGTSTFVNSMAAPSKPIEVNQDATQSIRTRPPMVKNNDQSKDSVKPNNIENDKK